MTKLKGVSFFCPAYYDEKNIVSVVDKADKVLSETCEDYEIVVINDGSPDKTKDVLDSLALRYPKLKSIHHARNLGYAEALKAGFKNAKKYEFILFTDGDNQYDIAYFKDMIKYIDDYDAVITYRIRNANNFIRCIISWMFNRVLNILFWQPFKDLSSSFRLVKRDLIKTSEFVSKGIFLPCEIVLTLKHKKYRIKEIPIVTRRREYGRSSSLLPKNFIGVFFDMLNVRLNLFK